MLASPPSARRVLLVVVAISDPITAVILAITVPIVIVPSPLVTVV